MEYSQCTSKCLRTCTNLYSVMPSDCNEECYPGCRCSPGTFLNSKGDCVLPDSCPCIYQQEEHPPNSVVKVDCNTWSVLYKTWTPNAIYLFFLQNHWITSISCAFFQHLWKGTLELHWRYMHGKGDRETSCVYKTIVERTRLALLD